MTKIIHSIIARLAKRSHSVIARRLVAEAIHAVATRPHLQIHNALSLTKNTNLHYQYYRLPRLDFVKSRNDKNNPLYHCKTYEATPLCHCESFRKKTRGNLQFYFMQGVRFLRRLAALANDKVATFS